MNLLAWPALVLLAAAAVLVMLAAWRTGPRQREVGTLMIWRRVAEQATAQKQRRRRLDWLLWLLLAVVAISAIGAARPAWFLPADRPQVAVFVERGFGEIEDVRERAAAETGESDLSFYAPGAMPDDFTSLNPGSIDAELAQFHARSEQADARLYFLNAPVELPGRVVPRAVDAPTGVVFEILSEGYELIVRHSDGEGVSVEGAEMLDRRPGDGVVTLRARAIAEQVRITDAGGGEYLLMRRPFVVGVGEDWNGNAHKALFEALQSDSAEDGVPSVWLGSNERAPAIRINRGDPDDLSQAELSFDPQHALFRELPLTSFDWRAMGRVMPRDNGTRPLLTCVRDGEVVGDVIRLRGDVLEFAGDPFSDAPIASAALLLDNAIGVVSGEQPSRRRGYEPAGEFSLPTLRAATAEAFEPYGELEVEMGKQKQPMEFSTWLLLAGGLLLLSAVVLISRRD